jgi:hypothetical protein
VFVVVGAWGKIEILHGRMRNYSMVADELYIKRGWWMPEDFIMVSLYLFI